MTYVCCVYMRTCVAHHITVTEAPYPLPNSAVQRFVRRCAAASRMTWEIDENNEGGVALVLFIVDLLDSPALVAWCCVWVTCVRVGVCFGMHGWVRVVRTTVVGCGDELCL